MPSHPQRRAAAESASALTPPSQPAPSGAGPAATGFPALIFRLAIGPDRRALQVNDWIETLTGYPAADFMAGAVSYAHCIHADDRPVVAAELRQAAASGSRYSLEYRVCHRDGSTRWVLENGHTLTLPQVGPVCDGVILDLSDRQRAVEEQQGLILAIATDPAVIAGDVDEALTRLTETAANAVHVARVGVWLLQGDDRLELQDLYDAGVGAHANAAVLQARRYPGYFEALHHGRALVIHDVREHAQGRELLADYWQPLGVHSVIAAAILLHGEFAGVVGFEHVGQARTWQAHEVHFAGEIADQVAALLMHRDRRDAAHEREQLRSQLFQAQKLEAVGRLAGGIAHDFNNMLTAISGSSELLQLTVPDLDAGARQLVADIIDTARRAGELTQGLLAFSRRQPSDLRPLNINQQTRDMQRLMQRLLGPDMELILGLERGVPMVLANPSQFEQVLSNLLVNARDAMPDGGRVLLASSTVHITHPEDAVTGTVTPGIYGALTMRDEGCGIPPEILADVFEPFYTTKSKTGGTGLGLSTVYGIVRQWGGHLRVVSVPGEGTAFTILVPATDLPAGQALPESDSPPDRLAVGGHEAIVVVEDEAMVRRFCEQVLQHLGYSVQGFADGDAAITYLARHPEVDLILTDMVMPGTDGIGLAKWIATQRPTVPVLFMTGYSATDTPTSEIFPHAGVVDKPFTTTTLAQAVRSALESAKRRRR